MANFNEALRKTLEHEGGYVDDPDDSGGETNYGITVKVARAFGYEGDMKTIPMTQVEGIYYNNYWLPSKCDKITDQRTAGKLFDTGVNMGVRSAVKIFQEAINSFQFDKIKVDGYIGQQTIIASLHIDKKLLLYKMRFLQWERYKKIMKRRLRTKKFKNGWRTRAFS